MVERKEKRNLSKKRKRSSMVPLVRNVVDGIIIGDKIVLTAVGL